MGYWKFEDDLTDEVNSQTLTGVGSPSYASGKFGKGISLASASTQYAYVNDTSELSITDNLTISSWVKRASTGSVEHTIVSKFNYSSSQAAYALAFSNDTLNFTWRSSGGGTDTSQATTGTFTSTSDYYHVVTTFAAGTIHIYVNGVDQQLGSKSGSATSIANTTAPFCIGTINYPSANENLFNGIIDDLAVFNRVLTKAEVIKLYRSSNPALFLLLQ